LSVAEFISSVKSFVAN